ncbi:MAG: DUF4293 domain-containing protein [Mucilaginibacter sp.]
MLQRIQSIYLLLASLVLFGLFVFPLVHDVYVNSAPLTVMVTGIYQNINGQQTHTDFFIALTAATAVVALLPLVIIFLYKNRKQQIALCYATMLVIIAFSYWVSQTVKNAIGNANLTMSNYGIGIILLSVSILFIVLAQKAIQRDDKLVKSADRLR